MNGGETEGKNRRKKEKNEQTVGFLAEKLPQNEQSEATDKLQHKNRYKKTISPAKMARLTIYSFLREIIYL